MTLCPPQIWGEQGGRNAAAAGGQWLEMRADFRGPCENRKGIGELKSHWGEKSVSPQLILISLCPPSLCALVG